VRTASLVALFVAMAAASLDGDTARASCGETVRWADTTYFPVGASQGPLTAGVALAGGVVPRCPGTMRPPSRDTPVRLRAIAGITPQAALVRADRPNRIFMAPGFVPQLPDFPLHDAIYGSRSKPDERTWEQPPGKRRFSCDFVVRRTVVGSVQNTLFFPALRLRIGRRDQIVFFDVRTRVPHERGTLPRFRTGMWVRVRLTECRRVSRFRYPVADRIDVLR
jgi:hypothetical protein